MIDMTFDIRPIRTYDEYKACERLQVEVMGYGELDVVPYSLLQSFAMCGGAVIGAFSAGVVNADALVGLVMGYTGLLEDGTPYHRSQRLAVLPRHRAQGVGEALKRAQADLVRHYGLRQMCWTFDPLRSINAHLNIHKLGAISRRYIEDAYAASSSPRDAGVAIDRLWVEWDLAADGVPGPIRPWGAKADERVPLAPVVLRDDNGAPSAPDLSSVSPAVVIQIPQDIDAVRAIGVQGVVAWRAATRAAFTHYLARGYRVIDYVRGQGYLLRNTA
jgi:predicted GNAT superfamily acetyltransferase